MVTAQRIIGPPLTDRTVRHLFEPRDTLFHRRMGAEKFREAATTERVHNEHVGSRRIGIHRDALRSHMEFLEGAGHHGE